MRALTATTDLWSFFGKYGHDWADGLLVEHVDMFTAAGGTIRTTGSGRAWAVRPDGRALPVVCAELVPVQTEDGPISGRCGRPAVDGACEDHAVMIAAYLADEDAYALHLEASMA